MRRALILAIIPCFASAFLAGSALGVESDFAERVNAYLSDPSLRIQRPQPLSAGLPKSLPATFIEDAGFDTFAGIPGDEPVLGNAVRFDGAEPSAREAAEVFKDEHWISMPRGRRILRLSPGTEKESWSFPTGTRLAHRFSLRTSPPRLFELRLMRKRADGKWAFGVYVPRGGRLVLMKRMESVSFDAARSSKMVRVEIARLHPESCRLCHMMHSRNFYPEEATAGPCGFGPANPSIRSAWALNFEAKHGYDPFIN